ncbi:MAG: Ig domain-containing protein [Thermacetogeniaceae bacterium]
MRNRKRIAAVLVILSLLLALLAPMTAAAATAKVTITPTTLSPATAGQSYTQATAFKASGTGTYTYSYNSSYRSGLPASMDFSTSTKKIEGTPIVAGSFTFEIDASVGSAVYASVYPTLTVKAPTITITGTLSAVTENVPFNQTHAPQIKATETGNSSIVITFSKIGGTLPGGVTFSTAGALYGTATAAGSFPFVVAATDANGFSASKSYTLTVKAPVITITATLPAAFEGVSYSGSFTAREAGSTGTVTCEVFFLPLPSTPINNQSPIPPPAGLEYAIASNGNGSISGVPTAAGIYPLEVMAEDVNGFYVTMSYTLTIKAPVVTISATLPAATAGEAYPAKGTAGFTAKDSGNKNAVFGYSQFGLPSGLELGAGPVAGAVTGTPAVAGSFPIMVVASEVYNSTTLAIAYGTFSLTVNAPTISFKTATVPAATAGSSYSGATFQAQESTNTSATFTYTIFGLPSWLTGTPTTSTSGTFTINVIGNGDVPTTAAGSYPFLVIAQDHNNFIFSKSFTLTVKSS